MRFDKICISENGDIRKAKNNDILVDEKENTSKYKVNSVAKAKIPFNACGKMVENLPVSIPRASFWPCRRDQSRLRPLFLSEMRMMIEIFD